MAAVEGKQRVEVDVGHAIGVGGAEGAAGKAIAEARMRPPVGVSIPVSTHSTSTPSGQLSAATNSSIISPR